jgi:hypothetical protein
MNNIVRIVLIVIGALILLGCGVLYLGTNNANKLIDEANIAIDAGNTAAQQGGAKYAELFTEKNLRDFPANRELLAATATELASDMDRAATNFDIAAKKFEQAAKQNVAATHAEYWKVKYQAFLKYAQSKRAFKSVAQLITDEKVATFDDFDAKMNPLIDEAIKADDEAKALAAKADELRDKNKDKFN